MGVVTGDGAWLVSLGVRFVGVRVVNRVQELSDFHGHDTGGNFLSTKLEFRLRKDTHMVLGMTLSTFTAVHVVISLIGIGSGFLVLYGMLNGKRFDGGTAIFLIFTVLTSATGFLFPFEHLLPSHIIGIISLVVLAIAIVARYSQHMAGSWRWIYVVCAVLAFYLNVFVLVAQIFLKVPAAHALAPTGKEPPFLIAQLIVMAIFIVCGVLAAKRFHPEAVRG
jgi:hypothetical protein